MSWGRFAAGAILIEFASFIGHQGYDWMDWLSIPIAVYGVIKLFRGLMP